MNDIQIKLKERRKALKLTQKNVANTLGITQQAYQQIESGEKDIRISTLKSLCEILEISADDLLGIKPMKFETPQVGEQIDIRKQATKAVSKAIRNSRKQYTLKQFGVKKVKKET